LFIVISVIIFPNYREYITHKSRNNNIDSIIKQINDLSKKISYEIKNQEIQYKNQQEQLKKLSLNLQYSNFINNEQKLSTYENILKSDKRLDYFIGFILGIFSSIIATIIYKHIEKYFKNQKINIVV